MTASTNVSLQPPIQTIVTGSENARTSFLPQLAGSLLVHEQCIVVDIHLLQTLPQHTTARLIAIVNNAAELYTVTRHKPSKLAVVAVCDPEESIRIRHAALHDLSAPGVLQIRNGQRARDVFARLIRVWRAGENEARAWGEPTLAESDDVIVPPTWDSVAKIAAVVDAAGLQMDQVLSKSSWGNIVEAVQFDLGDDETLQTDAATERKRANNKREQWTERLRQISAVTKESPGSNIETVSSVTTADHEQPQSDFFQKLLAGTR